MSFPCFAKLLRKVIDEHRWPWRLGYFQLGSGGLAVLSMNLRDQWRKLKIQL